ncbi:MAG: hypothetical protein JWL71_1895 [Acidobacteria bacterium]|nr:hypothetical protein [Acidobacteriota bacterium]
MTTHRTRILVLLCTAVAVAAGCSRRPPSRSAQVHQLKKSELSVAEQKYGVAPIPDKSVTYQPDVIVVGGGADAVRSLSSSGITWTIDAHAPRAAELAEGKIIFLTNLAVGRVLDVRKDGDNLAVTLGPVTLTDIIRQCDIRIDAMPIDFTDAIAFTVPDLPGRVAPAASAELRPSNGIESHVERVSYAPQSGSAPPPVRDVSNLVNFKVVPTADARGIGVRGTSDGGGLKMTFEALVRIQKPTLDAKIRITDGGGLQEAMLTLGGAAGLTLVFDAGTDVGLKANVNGRLQATPDFVMHIAAVGPVPIALTIRQQLIIKTALGVRNSTLKARGDYLFHGSFGVGYDGKQWGLYGPVGFSPKTTLIQTTEGVSLGAMGVNMTHQMRVVAGVGALGFAAGPHFALNTGVGIYQGSDLVQPPCRQATLHIGMSGGIGYLMPKPVTDAINFILGELHIHYRVAGAGSIDSKPMTIIDQSSKLAGCPADQG